MDLFCWGQDDAIPRSDYYCHFVHCNCACLHLRIPPSCPQSRVSIRACERSRWRHTARNSPMGLTALSAPLLPLLVLVLAHASLSDRLVIELQTKVHEVFTITGMAPTTAVSWLKVLTSTFTLKTVKSQVLAGAGDYFRPSKPYSGTL